MDKPLDEKSISRRETLVNSFVEQSEKVKSLHLKREMLKAASSLMEEEIFSAEFSRLAKPCP